MWRKNWICKLAFFCAKNLCKSYEHQSNTVIISINNDTMPTFFTHFASNTWIHRILELSQISRVGVLYHLLSQTWNHQIQTNCIFQRVPNFWYNHMNFHNTYLVKIKISKPEKKSFSKEVNSFMLLYYNYFHSHFSHPPGWQPFDESLDLTDF